MPQYKTIQNESSIEFVEKRSKFICYACPIKNESEASEYIKKISSRHFDAKHNVYTYRIKDGQIERYSDDGEPQGTAGMPMLSVIKGLELQNLVVVVTRYFGGILLGTGGLVRAYSHGARLAAENSGIVAMKKSKRVKAEAHYGIYGKAQNVLKNFGAKIESVDFLENVCVIFNVEAEQFENTQKKLQEISSGEILLEILEEKYCYFK